MSLQRRLARLEARQVQDAGDPYAHLTDAERMERITEILQNASDRRAQALGIEAETLTREKVNDILRKMIKRGMIGGHTQTTT